MNRFFLTNRYFKLFIKYIAVLVGYNFVSTVLKNSVKLAVLSIILFILIAQGIWYL